MPFAYEPGQNDITTTDTEGLITLIRVARAAGVKRFVMTSFSGGIDLDFVIRAPADEVYRRSRAMLERAASRGGYALGTGNSVPEYLPAGSLFAMHRAARDFAG